MVCLHEVVWTPGNCLGHFMKLYKELEMNMSRLKTTAILMFRRCSVASAHMEFAELGDTDMEDRNLISKSSKFCMGSGLSILESLSFLFMLIAEKNLESLKLLIKFNRTHIFSQWFC